jgi:hypothetical protein
MSCRLVVALSNVPFATALALAALALPASAQDGKPAAPATPQQTPLEEKVDRLERENEELKKKVDEIDKRLGGDAGALDRDLGSLGAPGTQGDGAAAPTKLSAAGIKLADAGLSQSFGGVYTKPFLTKEQSVTIGGYASWIYKDAGDANRSLDFPRLIPFIYAQVSERVTFATEIEIEDGHEVEVEFAFVDYHLADFVNLRGGVILDPLGKFNLVHDDPVNELTERPLVDTTVIPTTLREVGGGFFGTLLPADSASGQVTYEAYVTSGFKGLFNDGTVAFDTTDGLTNGRAHEQPDGTESFADNNNNLAQVGRLEWSPVLGTQLGVSAHHGNYDQGDDNELLITAVDGALDGKAVARWLGADGDFGRVIGGFELLGEWANARISRDAFATASGVPGSMHGWYGQVDYRIYPSFLNDLEQSGYLGAGSRFTLVARYDAVDLDGFGRERWTLGVNFRPNRYQTVVKFDYQFNTESGNEPGKANDAFLMSIATYF